MFFNVDINNTDEEMEIAQLFEAYNLLCDVLPIGSSEHQYNNDLYDKIKIGYLKQSPDGSEYQQELKDKDFTCTYKECKISILTRINNVIAPHLPTVATITM